MMMPVGLGQDSYVMECSEMGMVEDPATGACMVATVSSEYGWIGLTIPEPAPIVLPTAGGGATVSYPTWDIYKLATGALVKILSTATPPAGATLVTRGTTTATVTCKSGVDTATGKCKDVVSGVPNTYLLIGGGVLVALLVVMMGKR